MECRSRRGLSCAYEFVPCINVLEPEQQQEAAFQAGSSEAIGTGWRMGVRMRKAESEAEKLKRRKVG
eukprot:1157335-Pelagomonas_calceolata.AAC.6